LDVGVRHVLTDSDGLQVENPHYMKETLKKLRRKQKKLSRKRKGSNNRNKQRIRVANLHEKVVNQRDDFLHGKVKFFGFGKGLLEI
jgi:putative transposase